MGKLIQICLGMVMSSAAFSQPTAGTHPPVPGASSAKAEKATATKTPPPINATPSRFVGPAELEPFIGTQTASFSMRDRATDPFGQPQDPNAKPVIKAPTTKVAQRAQQVMATPFSDIVRLLVVTTIMPGEKRFLVGTRSIAQGDRIPLSYHNKQIHIEVTEVNSRQIVLRNLDTGETAARKLDMLPAGMSTGLRGISAPGMVPDRPNAPIELDAGESAIETSQNR